MVVSGHGPAVSGLQRTAGSCHPVSDVLPRAAETLKRSRSFRRKQRERRVAVRHALKSSLELGNILGQDITTSLQVAHSQTQDGLDGRLHDLSNIMRGLMRLEQKFDLFLHGSGWDNHATMQSMQGLDGFSPSNYWNVDAHAFEPGGWPTASERIHESPQIESSCKTGSNTTDITDDNQFPTSADRWPTAPAITTVTRTVYEHLPSVGTWIALPPRRLVDESLRHQMDPADEALPIFTVVAGGYVIERGNLGKGTEDCDVQDGRIADNISASAESGISCVKCGGEECFCWEVFCRQCQKNAQDCLCETCFIRRRSCAACLLIEDRSSPFDLDSNNFYTPLPTSFVCSSCGSTEVDANSNGYYCMESARSCATCKRIGYHNFRECDLALTCEAHMLFHESCLNINRGQYMCNDCLENAQMVVPQTGWPTFDKDQQQSFQSWYAQRLDKIRAAIFHISSDSASREANDMRRVLDEVKDAENVRKAAWRFYHAKIVRTTSD